MANNASELFGRGYQILNNRNIYENRQRKWTMMRVEGLRRKNKPFPQAADLHLKLIDEKVNQKKAFTLAQAFGNPTLSTFVCMKQQAADLTQSAQEFFSFELKHRSNLMRTLMTAVDTMWLRGRGIIKSYVDPFDDYRIVHENVDPLYLLMPDDVNDFEDSYEWVHVRQMNVAKFMQDRRYCQEYRTGGEIDKGTIKKICGGKDAAERLRTQRGRDFDLIQLDKELREGYTHSNSSDTIIVWEHYIRTMGGLTVYSHCPVATDVEIRKPFGVPYKVNGKVTAPFFSFVAEVQQEGWYSSRGVAEKIADNEIYGCKLWNAKADAMTYLNTPMYTSEVGGVQNPANYRMAPGEVLPPGIKPIIYGTPPISFDQELQFTRMEADAAAQVPNINIPQQNKRGREHPTAKQVQVESTLSQVATNSEGTIFMEDLSKLYNFDWNLMLQYKRKELTYFMSEDCKTLPQEAMHSQYLIMAGGATDDWDKQQRIQKATDRYELLVGKPNVDQDELLSEYLGASDARLVKKLVIPSKQHEADEAEDESMEITSMITTHYPAPVKPQENHLVRAMTMLQFLSAQNVKSVPVDPLAKQRLLQHLQQHIQLLKKQDPKGYKQVEMAVKQMEAQAQQQARTAPMMAHRRPLPSRVPPMRPAGNQTAMRML